MDNNFFNLVKDNFFNPLTGQNKVINYKLLNLINNKMSLDNLTVDKDTIVNWIEEYLDDNPVDIYDTDNMELVEDNHEKALNRFNYYFKCGWLLQEIDGYKYTYQFDENGINILKAMNESLENENATLEFSGYVYNIYSLLNYNFNYDHSVEIVEQTYKNVEELNRMLKGLSSSIKKYLNKLLNENKDNPKEILEVLFKDYYERVVIKAFTNFRQKDNPSRYKNQIQNRIEELLEENNLNKMINNYIKVKCNDINNSDNRELAISFFKDKLDIIYDFFENVEMYLDMLDGKNTKYVNTAESRLMFLLNENTDIEGKINNCLKGLSELDNKFYETPNFELFVNKNIDENSLSEPIKRKAKMIQDPIIDTPIISEEEIESIKNKLFNNDEYSIKKIDDFVLKLLGSNNKINSKEIKIKEFDDLLKIFLACIYSSDKNISYNIIFKSNIYNVLNYRIREFEIERRTK